MYLEWGENLSNIFLIHFSHNKKKAVLGITKINNNNNYFFFK